MIRGLTAPLITSAAMVGGGTLIALTGLAVGGGYLLSATRQWINEMEVPPSELARHPGERVADGRARALLVR